MESQNKKQRKKNKMRAKESWMELEKRKINERRRYKVDIRTVREEIDPMLRSCRMQ